MIDEETRARVLLEPPYSISQLRAYTRCPKSYELQYLTDPRVPVRDMGAVVWFGAMMQRIIQKAYYDLPLYEALMEVWQQECPTIFEALQDWYQLDSEYRQSGNPNTAARKHWPQEHPRYQELSESITAYQREALGMWNWKERFPLTACFRWASTFAQRVPRERALLPGAVLVEGIPLFDPDGALIPLVGGTVGQKHYRVLHGVCGEQNEVHVVGVPDEFAIDDDGVAWICDNKVTASMLTAEQCKEDMQLATYVVLLLQNHRIEPGQPTMVGHKYLQEDDVVYVWGDTSRYEDLVLPALHEQFSALKAARRFPRMRGIQPSAFSPCKTCGVAYACLTSQVSYRSGQVGQEQFAVEDVLAVDE